VLDRVRVVWAWLLEKPLEVVCRWPHWTLATAHVGQDACHTEAARLPVGVIIADGRGPLKALLASLAAVFDTLLGAVNGDVRWHLLVTPQECFRASLCRAVAGQNPPGSSVSTTRGAGKPTLPPMEPRDL
jgi:hypothetical protein